ncbi:hypothetical protein VNI00_015219 [Paramarasmius palmivorus]|uniref:Uncharacterized protein n=1 Tax=Paramarasmius palmivorus TaxID=297713 RepID=A0AAW0BLX3_9AGAR
MRHCLEPTRDDPGADDEPKPLPKCEPLGMGEISRKAVQLFLQLCHNLHPKDEPDLLSPEFGLETLLQVADRADYWGNYRAQFAKSRFHTSDIALQSPENAIRVLIWDYRHGYHNAAEHPFDSNTINEIAHFATSSRALSFDEEHEADRTLPGFSHSYSRFRDEWWNAMRKYQEHLEPQTSLNKKDSKWKDCFGFILRYLDYPTLYDVERAAIITSKRLGTTLKTFEGEAAEIVRNLPKWRDICQRQKMSMQGSPGHV